MKTCKNCQAEKPDDSYYVQGTRSRKINCIECWEALIAEQPSEPRIIARARKMMPRVQLISHRHAIEQAMFIWNTKGNIANGTAQKLGIIERATKAAGYSDSTDQVVAGRPYSRSWEDWVPDVRDVPRVGRLV